MTTFGFNSTQSVSIVLRFLLVDRSLSADTVLLVCVVNNRYFSGDTQGKPFGLNVTVQQKKSV